MATIRARSIVLIPADALDINGEPHLSAGLRYIVEQVFTFKDRGGFDATGVLVSSDEEIAAAADATAARRRDAGADFTAITPDLILQVAKEIEIDSAAVTVLRF